MTALTVGLLLVVAVSWSGGARTTAISSLIWSLLLASFISTVVGRWKGTHKRRTAFLATLGVLAVVGIATAPTRLEANRAASVDGLLSDVRSGSAPAEDSIDDVVDGAQGAISPSEAECMIEAVAASGLTYAELERAAAEPTDPGSDEAAALFLGCLEQEVDITIPLQGDVRDDVVDAFVDAGLTRGEADCYVKGLAAAGVDARDLLLLGSDAPPSPEVEAITDRVARRCIPDLVPATPRSGDRESGAQEVGESESTDSGAVPFATSGVARYDGDQLRDLPIIAATGSVLTDSDVDQPVRVWQLPELDGGFASFAILLQEARGDGSPDLLPPGDYEVCAWGRRDSGAGSISSTIKVREYDWAEEELAIQRSFAGSGDWAIDNYDGSTCIDFFIEEEDLKGDRDVVYSVSSAPGSSHNLITIVFTQR